MSRVSFFHDNFSSSPVPGFVRWVEGRLVAGATGNESGPVARLHLCDGASLDDVLPEAGPSPGARARSAGVRVSHRYDLERVEASHERFAGEQSVVTSGRVEELLAAPHRQRRRA